MPFAFFNQDNYTGIQNGISKIFRSKKAWLYAV